MPATAHPNYGPYYVAPRLSASPDTPRKGWRELPANDRQQLEEMHWGALRLARARLDTLESDTAPKATGPTKRRLSPSAAADPVGPSVDDEDLSILRALAESPPAAHSHKTILKASTTARQPPNRVRADAAIASRQSRFSPRRARTGLHHYPKRARRAQGRDDMPHPDRVVNFHYPCTFPSVPDPTIPASVDLSPDCPHRISFAST